MTVVRTRFAPSPTGYLHIGGFRTALYAWLWARHNGGQFILRIEDTDQNRKVPGAVRAIIEAFQWFQLDYDEGPTRADLAAIGELWDGAPDVGGPAGPYVQSQRVARYREIAERLIELGVAYRCDCTPERLEQVRSEQQARKELTGYDGHCRDREVDPDSRHVVRLKFPASVHVVLNDIVRGEVVWDSPSLRDPVLLKSDGHALYHLACVVDDHDMEITHVLRGEEWLASTPIHLLLYQALGWEPPLFGHLSQILGKDGKKLSKRHGAAAIEEFRQAGYLPEALLNYAALIGWNPGASEEHEILSRQDLIRLFELDRLNKAGGVFDFEKLEWMNGAYIRDLNVDEFTARVLPIIEGAGLSFDQQRWDPVARHIQERTKQLTDVVSLSDFLFRNEIERDVPAMLKKGMTAELAMQALELAQESLASLPSFEPEQIEAELRSLAERLGCKPGPVFMVMRIAISGKPVSPPLCESMMGLGRAVVLQRLKETKALLA